ncbi:MAG: hypothetical protein OJF49_004672 [Ktedonobacterales bacterium]|nr:MAG: hypothetical protein OJF49_004672 [Ktedonobacterales bacterium]
MFGSFAHLTGHVKRQLVFWVGVCALLLSSAFGASLVHAMPPGISTATWKTFTDPVYGFTLQYPTSWNLVVAPDGSHITIANSHTGATIAPIMQSQSGTAMAALSGATNTPGATIKWITVNGATAVDVTQPFTPGSTFNPAGALITRTVTFAKSSGASLASSNATMTYALQLTVKTDNQGHLSAAGQADVNTFNAVVQTFRLPTKVMSPLNPSPNNCPVYCWADDNWNFNLYDDSSNGRDCANVYYNCVYEQKAPANRYQPDFQCAEFVSRAVAQGYTVPGLINGGVAGFSGTVTGHSGAGWDFGKYSMTKAPYNGTAQYWLTDTGGAGNPSGLYDYLINDGIGINEGTNLGPTGWGDVIFFYEGQSTIQHVMVVTGLYTDSSGKIHIIADGHNYDQYHVEVAVSGQSGFVLVHIPMDQQDGISTLPTYYSNGDGPAWSSQQTDGWGQPYRYAYMTGGNFTSASGDLAWSGNTFTSCGIAIFTPNASIASATATVEVDLANRSSYYFSVSEANLYGAALIVKPNTYGSPITYVSVYNANGNASQAFGLGQIMYFC